MVLWLFLTAATASGPHCSSATVGAAGGTVRTVGAQLAVPAGLWSGRRTVTLCPIGTGDWGVHLPVRGGTHRRGLVDGLTLHVEATSSTPRPRPSIDILFVVDDSCSMSEPSTLSFTATHDPTAPLVDRTTPTQPAHPLKTKVIRQTASSVTLLAGRVLP
ncbi:MAG: hypothetical protein AAF602_22230 [Myxococcota bacterium]